MTTTEELKIKKRITSILEKNTGISPSRIEKLLPLKSLQGKLYEADVLATVCENLVTKEKLQIKLINGTKLMLKQKGSPVNRAYPFLLISKNNSIFAELWTDIYFNTMSYSLNGSPRNMNNGDYHEIDIALLTPNINGFPKHTDILLAIECKNTSLKKSIIRELLGFRRELSFYYEHSNKTNFDSWPASSIYAQPNSVHMLYCSDKEIIRYEKNCFRYGILLQCHKM
jgi:hypothetical protein